MLELCGFNPRARDGRESYAAGQWQRIQVSIHAPVMDANDGQVFGAIRIRFQSTRP